MRTRAALHETEEQGNAAAASLLSLAPFAALQAALEAAQANAVTSRGAAARADAALEGFEREIKIRQERIEAIAAEQELWRKRIENAREQIATLRAREEETERRSRRACQSAGRDRAAPPEVDGRIAVAEREPPRPPTSCAIADTALKAREESCARRRSASPTSARPARRTEARLECARASGARRRARIRDQLDCAPEGCLALAGVKPDAPLPSARRGRQRGSRSSRPIASGSAASICRAEEELTELAEQLEEHGQARRPTSRQAIAKLRAGHRQISTARAASACSKPSTRSTRISSACSRRCSAAARPSCELIESDDPLEAGLEIIATPAGQEAADAVAAVGRRAGADGAGADLRRVPHQPVADLRARRGRRAARRRQCRALLHADGGDGATTPTRASWSSPTTRITMARMNRLFGVTMAERGREPARLGRPRNR